MKEPYKALYTYKADKQFYNEKEKNTPLQMLKRGYPLPRRTILGFCSQFRCGGCLGMKAYCVVYPGPK